MDSGPSTQDPGGHVERELSSSPSLRPMRAEGAPRSAPPSDLQPAPALEKEPGPPTPDDIRKLFGVILLVEQYLMTYDDPNFTDRTRAEVRAKLRKAMERLKS